MDLLQTGIFQMIKALTVSYGRFEKKIIYKGKRKPDKQILSEYKRRKLIPDIAKIKKSFKAIEPRE